MKNFTPPKRLQGIEKSVIRQVFDRARPGSINLGLGEPDLPTPDVIRRAAVKAIVEEQNGYTSHAGLPSLREKVASEYPYLKGRPGRVVITAGSQEALYLALLALSLGQLLVAPELRASARHPSTTGPRRAS